MIHWIVFPLALVLALFLVALRTAAKHLVTPRTQTLKSADDIRNLLNPPNSSIVEILAARAAPNQRLVHAFGLTNTFVSADPKVHRTFTTKAKGLITSPGMKGGGWEAMARTASEITPRFLPEQPNKVEFATFIQCVAFSVVLSSLFGAHPDALHRDDVIYVTNIINKRWTESKARDPTTMIQDDSLRRITDLIDAWIGDRDRYPNPLNFILPAYETMWRVVAVAIAHIYRYRDITLHDAVIAFGRDPTEEHFESFEDNGMQPSVQAIVLEVLRLHPPTRHISRASTESGSWWRKLLAPATIWIADIEAVHRSEEFGENVAEFDPMRFHPSRMQGRGRAELFAFGYGKLGCVAAGWAPMAAAVIAAKVIEEVEEAGFAVRVGRKIGGRSGWDGWMVTGEA